MARTWETDERVREILARPLNQETQWIVVTGPPHSGKTSLVAEFAAHGYPISTDISRTYIEELLALGRSASEVRASPFDLQREIFIRMLVATAALPLDRCVVHDYGLPDNVAFWTESGLSVPADVRRSAELFRYRAVLFLEPLSFYETDRVRTEPIDFQRRIAARQLRIYEELGYQPVVVAPLPLRARVAAVAEWLALPPDPM